MPLRSPVLIAAAAVTILLALSGCAGEGVDLNGKIFDMLGVSGAAKEGRTREPKMADRAPLVVPPSVTRLPEPGSGRASSEDVAALNDPELRKQAAAQERERLHLAYCRGERTWKDKAYSPEKTQANVSPYGPCPVLMSGITSKANN